MRYAKAVTAAAAAAVVCACSGAPAAPAAPRSASALAARLGCRHWVATVPPGLFTRTEGGCKLGRLDVVLATFGDADGQHAWVQAETSLGGILVQGRGWAANAPTTGTARTVAVRLGGRVTG